MKSKESIFKNKLTWAVFAELAILIVAGILEPSFFRVEYNAVTGMLYGSLIDIINRSAEITIIAMGMTMVIALGGTDISVGALVAVGLMHQEGQLMCCLAGRVMASPVKAPIVPVEA